ncbi:hypothetical protein AHF37_06470 [Paragonimus kellicotti]|nr:hypothetical protein AHF37_06470 [Paragonimus kellicotti]
MRNDIAHGSIPCESLLERGFYWALNFLEEFWSLNTIHMIDTFSGLDRLLEAAFEEVRETISHGHSDGACVRLEKALSNNALALPVVRYICSALVEKGMNYESSVTDVVSICRRLSSLLLTLKHKRVLHLLILEFLLSVRVDAIESLSAFVTWSMAWITALRDFRYGVSNPIENFLDAHCVESFNWRRAFRHIVIDHSLIESYDLCVEIVRCYQPSLPFETQESVLQHLRVFLGLDTVLQSTEDECKSVCKRMWSHSANVLWAEQALGVVINDNAPASRQHQRFPPQNPAC